MDTYLGQKKESFTKGTKDLDKLPVKLKCQCGVLILTKQKVLWNEVFNCFGIHSLFDMYVLDSTTTGLMPHLIGRPITVPFMRCSPELNSTMYLPHHSSSPSHYSPLPTQPPSLKHKQSLKSSHKTPWHHPYDANPYTPVWGAFVSSVMLRSSSKSSHGQ